MSDYRWTEKHYRVENIWESLNCYGIIPASAVKLTFRWLPLREK